ncbi:PucR family transcriptional regulator [Rhodococcus opacus]|uniref:ABC transporter substrate-binding protein n=1 Tax=Rhodococcus opacus TaxID=37919 RepID=A0A2S8J4S5_RHOOP|nr:helix-turn-helix domain-containing protein [Rhodococcus opacus]PQP22080.1 ABC transporter substrate-binding protein [Rhodococcus opacus]
MKRASDDRVAHSGSGVHEVVLALTTAADRNLEKIAGEIVTRLTSEIAEFTADEPIVEQLNAGAAHNFAITMRILRHDIEIDQVDPSEPANELARLLAQREIPVTALEHAYRLYQDSVVRWCLQELAVRSDDAAVTARAALEITTLVSAHVNLIAQDLLTTYEAERDAWRLRRSASRSARIRDILGNRAVDIGSAEAALGYPLSQYHLGVIVWTERGERFDDEPGHHEGAVTALAAHLGICGRPLFEPRDEHTGWAWLPLGQQNSLDLDKFASITASWDLPVAVAVGAPQKGLAGFVRTHSQANQARTVAQASSVSTPRVISIAELGAVALMCSDLSAGRAWVADVLGPLAADDPANEDLRMTLREFLRTGGSYAATATALHMHRNSVAYRIHKVEDQLGRSVRDRRLELENALELCLWLGAAVLATDQHDAGTS